MTNTFSINSLGDKKDSEKAPLFMVTKGGATTIVIVCVSKQPKGLSSVAVKVTLKVPDVLN